MVKIILELAHFERYKFSLILASPNRILANIVASLLSLPKVSKILLKTINNVVHKDLHVPSRSN